MTLDYLQVCKEIANKSVCHYKHGAILVYKKNIIARGYNDELYKFPLPVGSFSIHAEANVIRQIDNKYRKKILENCVLYVVRINKNGQLMNSKPCNNCQKLIDKYNLTVVHS